jgi:acyl transferase domain-containing protein/3-hydroxymyristoyl/3-hydroxydecanoyl-(acyl carrier protein) dehydratase
LDQLDPLFRLGLHAALDAWSDARTDSLDLGRVGVILGHIVLPTETSTEFSRQILMREFEAAQGLPAAEGASAPVHPINAFPAGLPAKLIARALGLGGTAFTLDAACASSLHALALAVSELRSGRADAMIAGGLSRPDPLFTQMGFSQLRALSARGKPAPFDALGDGLVVGEGSGMVVLKRLGDALAHGDRIRGLIAGIGLSNDVRGDLLAPSSEGQLRAMRAAYEQAGWSPRDVDLIECHATGTPVGDAVEVESLKSLWETAPRQAGGRARTCVIGSAKSNIGHTLTAAGSAGLIKILMAFGEETLPPTANFQRAAPKLDLENSPFRVLDSPEPWRRRSGGQPRRAALSAFGFGGINAHVLIEEWTPRQESRSRPNRPIQPRPDSPIAVVGMSAHFGPRPGLAEFQSRVLAGEAPDSRKDDDSIAEFSVRLDQFRIPPVELEAILPQQSLMLKVAQEAIADSVWEPSRGLKTGVLIGIGLDLNSTNFQLRWTMLDRARGWNEQLGLGLSDSELKTWAEELRGAAGPPLTPNRTMGALGGLIASRIAREFHLGGPSFTISDDETSGNQAIRVAIDWLRDGMLDAAVVGAVDLPTDPRISAASAQLADLPRVRGCDGAGAIVLKRLDDARRDGDRIYAVIGETSSSTVSDARTYPLFRPVGAGSDSSGRQPRDQVGVVNHPPEPRRGGTASPASLAAAPPLRDSGAQWMGVQGGSRTDSRGLHPGLSDPAPSGLTGPTLTGESGFDADARRGSPDPDVTADRIPARRDSQDRGLTPPARQHAARLGNPEEILGHAGAASDLASVIKSILCLYQQIVPGDCQAGPQFWARNRDDDSRRAVVDTAGLGGSRTRIVLEEFAGESNPRAAGERSRPLGRYDSALFALGAADKSGLLVQIDSLARLAEGIEGPIEDLARRWWRTSGEGTDRRLKVAVVADGRESLLVQLNEARDRLTAKAAAPIRRPGQRGFLAFSDAARAEPPRVAFVYPGLGNTFAGMGRGLSALWPDVMRRQEQGCTRYRDQMSRGTFWNEPLPTRFDDHVDLIVGQVVVGSLVTDIIRRHGVEPDAAIGYSMGETSALVALGAWNDRDELLRRIDESPLFRSELAGASHAARRFWSLPDSEPVDWAAGIVVCPADRVKQFIGADRSVFLLIVNSSQECVIGGIRRAVAELVRKLAAPFVEIPAVSTVHCPVGALVEPEYHALHDLPTQPIAIPFYSGVWARPYRAERATVAEAIKAQAGHPIDFPAVIDRAYSDGIRVFLEMGPGGSCSRMIDQILGDRPHLARSAHLADRDPYMTILIVLADLIAWNVPVDLSALYGDADSTPSAADGKPPRLIRIPVGLRPFTTVMTPEPKALPKPLKAHPLMPNPLEAHVSDIDHNPLIHQWSEAQTANIAAHAAYLRVAADLADQIGIQLARQMSVLEGISPSLAPNEANFPCPTGLSDLRNCANEPNFGPPAPNEPNFQCPTGVSDLQNRANEPNLTETSDGSVGPANRANEPNLPAEPVALDRNQCMEYAIGSIAAVLGPEFAEIDAHPTRVRLPDEPLMLVDRVILIEGKFRSLTQGRVVTEHDVLPGGWYLNANRIAPSIAIESGQADLFLSGYLGIDFETKGLAVYRLLDATVTFHRGLPGPGEVIRYDIRITEFFRQGETRLFRFQFEGTVNGEPLLTMKDGCAGFFSPGELAAGKGIVPRPLDSRPRPGVRPADWTDLVPPGVASLDEHQVDRLRQGDFATAFGRPFDRLGTLDWLRLPGERMKLVDRIVALDTSGGRFGLGQIRAEADIHPDDWFIVCHFVDDRVMPGTLMYEGCLHTLRIFLMRLGWVGEASSVAYEPVPGAGARLRCRGQVLESTRKVTYEITIKELGYRPEPYAIADALMYADGKAIVEIADLSLQLTGTNRADLEALWANPQASEPAFFNEEQFLQFATGKPSLAFGETYRVFDEERFIARLPAPPYQFLSRIVRASGRPFVMEAGGTAEAEYDVPADAWYFDADRQDRMPFGVLLEIPLQACGWISSYMGSALQSPEPLKYRNLGGTARQHAAVTRTSGRLSILAKCTKVSSSGGMILQNFEFSVRDRTGLVYDGNTYFGFFRPEALAEQVGVRDTSLHALEPVERARAQTFDLPALAPFPDRGWRMLDRVTALVLDGGPSGLGFIEGTTQVDPEAWFFRAHFHQDPVWPGSLGLESLLQLLKVVASARWGSSAGTEFESVALDEPHHWEYRGQVIPTNRFVTVQAVITARDDARRLLRADGLLAVDGKVIYRMKDFCLRMI